MKGSAIRAAATTGNRMPYRSATGMTRVRQKEAMKKMSAAPMMLPVACISMTTTVVPEVSAIWLTAPNTKENTAR